MVRMMKGLMKPDDWKQLLRTRCRCGRTGVCQHRQKQARMQRRARQIQKEKEWEIEETKRTCELLETIVVEVDGTLFEWQKYAPKGPTDIESGTFRLADELGRVGYEIDNAEVTNRQNTHIEERKQRMVEIAELIAEKVI